MKKILIFVLSFCMIGTILTACGNTTETETNSVESTESEYTENIIDSITNLARDYLDASPTSYQQLIYRLVNEGYSEVNAKEAVIRLGADWSEEAVRMAIYLLSTHPYSEENIRTLLSLEKFTDEQIQYAIDNCNADWNEQAILRANQYLSLSDSLDHDNLMNKLIENDGFTNEQADYGATQALKDNLI